jgi:hypothetical protein
MHERNAISDNTTRIRILAPHEASAEGLSTISVDLGGFFVIVGRVGRDEALLLLVIRALRHRASDRGFRLHDLAWVLRETEGGVQRWLDRLTHHGLVVYDEKEAADAETITIEVAAEEVRGWVPRMHDLPSHWFTQTLPLVGRTTFTVFLFLLSRDAHEGLARIADIVHHVRLPNARHAHRHLNRLRAHAILAPHPTNGTLTVKDPPPLTMRQRVHLRVLALPFFRSARAEIIRLALCVVLLVILLLLGVRAPHLLYR